MDKSPYINDKKMYAAVMGVIKCIRESGYFNKVVLYHADKFDVDAEEITKHIRIAQSNGQKGRKRGSYKYYAVHGHYVSGRSIVMGYEEDLGTWQVVKAMNENNVDSRLSKNDDYSEYGSQFCYGVCKEFNTKKDAEKYIKEMELSKQEKGLKEKELKDLDLKPKIKKEFELELDFSGLIDSLTNDEGEK